jgi:1,4-dihydroxy-6-naphthoate synthase
LLQQTYHLLDSGGALGQGVGPLLIAKKEIAPDAVPHCVIAIPGVNTTAHLLFSLAFPDARKKKFMIFSAIEEAVLSGKADAGVIIHENRFTYAQKGLQKVMDLGEFWEQKTGCPIPLGGIVMKKSFGEETCTAVDTLIRRSVEFDFGRYPELPVYVKEHASEMDEQVMRKHIDLYVNNYSISLGTLGKEAIQTLLGISETLPG